MDARTLRLGLGLVGEKRWTEISHIPHLHAQQQVQVGRVQQLLHARRAEVLRAQPWQLVSVPAASTVASMRLVDFYEITGRHELSTRSMFAGSSGARHKRRQIE